VEQLDASSEFLARHSLFLLLETSPPDECGEEFDVGTREHRIVQKFLVTLVTEDAALPLHIPRTGIEDPLATLVPAVG
jgi:hypothetical protein